MSSTIPTPQGRNLAILGAGVLGRRIACVWAASGYHVILRDPSPEQLIAAQHYLDTNVEDYQKRLGVAATVPGKYETTSDLETAVKNAWFVIEAVPEKLQLKIDTMGELDKLTPSDCIIGSNSSSYKSSLMLEKVGQPRKSRILNVHYQMPPDARVVELMTDGETGETVFDCLIEHHRKIGMMPVKVRKESTGFIMNRIWAAVKRECLMVLGEGVGTAEEIDSLWGAMFETKVKPCAMMDSVGLDTVAFIEDNYIKERGLPSTYTVDFLRKEYIDQGRLGAKSGKGGLFPPGHTTKPSDEAESHHENMAAPTLYFLDIGAGGEGPISPNAASMGQVLLGSPDGRAIKPLVSNLPMPDGIDVHLPSGRMFWTCMGIPSANDGVVMSAKLDGSDVKTILPKGALHTGKQLVVDSVNLKLYFSDREGLRVMRCNLDGSEHETIIQTGDWHNETQMADETLWPVGISVDAAGRKFYWTQKGPSKGGKGRIFRASMDMPDGFNATNRPDIELLFENLPEPIDLEFVGESNTLYWTDRGEHPVGNTLNRADVGPDHKPGDKKYEIISRHFHEAIGAKIDKVNHHIYVADLGGALYRMNMDGSDRKRIYDTELSFTGVALVHVG